MNGQYKLCLVKERGLLRNVLISEGGRQHLGYVSYFILQGVLDPRISARIINKNYLRAMRVSVHNRTGCMEEVCMHA